MKASQGQIVFNKPLLAYDTSVDSQYMLQVFKQMKTKFTNPTFIYVHDPIKRFVPNQLLGQNVFKSLEEKLKGSNAHIQLRQLYQGKTTNDMILETYLQLKCNILFLGFTGLKGRKNHQLQFSSRVRQFVYDTKFQLAIIKNSPRSKQSAIFCTDGSQNSFDGLQKAINFCRMQNLNLKIFHATNQDLKKYSKQVKTALKQIVAKTKGVNLEIAVQQSNLIQYLKKDSCNHDWIIMTKNGYRGQISNKNFIGSNATEIIAKVNANILLLN